MTVLCTGFDPFADHDTNPSGQLARRLDGARIAGLDVVGRVLPVAFDASGDRLRDLIDLHNPSTVIATGLAAGSPAIRVERVGINVADAVGTPDNDSRDPVGEQIDPEGPPAYFASLPVREIVTALLETDIPARVSNSAGTHLCNDLLYETRSYLDYTGQDIPAGFLHLPLAPAGAARKARSNEASRGGAVPPSLPLETCERAVRIAVETAL